MRFFYCCTFSVLLLAGCGNGSGNESKDGKPDLTARSVAISGLYADTIPGAGPGQEIYMEVTLAEDSSFVLTRFTISSEEGKPIAVNGPKSTLRGIYIPHDNWSWIKLSSSQDGGISTSFSIMDNAIRLLDADGRPYAQGDYDLERSTRPVSSVGDYLLIYDDKAFSKYPAQVFLRTAGNHIRIHKPYLDQASQSEKAIVAYYTLRYNTGCDVNGCAMNTAMNMSDDQMSALVSSQITEHGLPSQNTAPVERERLTMLLMVKTPGGFQVHYTYMNSHDANFKGMDEYAVDDKVRKIKSAQPEAAGK